MTQLFTDESGAWAESLTAGLTIRSLTKRLVIQLCWDLPLSIPVIVDFGVDSR